MGNLIIENGADKVKREFALLMSSESVAKAKKSEEEIDNIKKMMAMQWKMCVDLIKKKCAEDAIFNAKVMNPDLTLGLLFSFLTKKARELLVPGMNFVGVTDETVMNWIVDFYTEEGVLLIEEQKKKQEEAKKKAEELKKKKAEKKPRKKRASKKKPTEEEKATVEDKEPAEPIVLKEDASFEDVKTTVDSEGQMSLV